MQYPFHATLLGLAPEPDVEERVRVLARDSVQRQSHEAVLELARSLSRRQPLALVLEDLHFADEPTLDRLEGEGRVVARYLDVNPNGSLRGIAGITNERGNVVGLMPHPEHAVDPLCGPGSDGLGFFTSALSAVAG